MSNKYPKAPDQWFTDEIARGRGIFDRDSFEFMLTWIKPERMRTVLDIGAHVGTWSIPLSQKFQRVDAYEPNDENFNFLVDNIGEIQNIIPWNFALGNNHKSYVSLKDGADNNGQTHIDEVYKNGASGLVQMLALDQMIDLHEDIDLIKLDVEGYEQHVLMGGRQTILRQKPAIYLEFNGLGSRYGSQDTTTTIILQNWGYDIAGKCNKDFLFLPKGY